MIENDTPRTSPIAKRILVVEDDEGLRESMTRALTRAGFEVVLASNGADALEVGREAKPDAAIIDLFLPDSGGLGVARGLRQSFESVPVLFITALALPVVREALAPSPVLFKPFTRGELLANVRQIARAA